MRRAGQRRQTHSPDQSVYWRQMLANGRPGGLHLSHMGSEPGSRITRLTALASSK